MSNLEHILLQIKSEIKIDPLTGKGSASIRAVARLADISPGGLADNLNSGVHLKPSPLAEYLISTGLEGVQLVNFSETKIPDVVAASILEYYAFDAGRYIKPQAQLVCRAFLRVGIRAWMQDITGYVKPSPEPQFNKDEFLIQQLPFTPKQWECRFKPEFWAALESLYGLKRGQLACSRFISHWVYGYFPQEVRDRINDINPIDDTQCRKVRIHQHFEDKLSKALDMQISIVTTNLIRAKTRNHFKRLMSNARRYSFTMKNLPLIGA